MATGTAVKRRRQFRQIGARGGIANPVEVGGRIREARQAMGLSQVQFGAKLDIHRKQIARYERGQYVTRLALQQIATMTREPLEWFLTGRRPGMEALALSQDPEIRTIARRLLPSFEAAMRDELRGEVAFVVSTVLRELGEDVLRIADRLAAKKRD